VRFVLVSAGALVATVALLYCSPYEGNESAPVSEGGVDGRDAAPPSNDGAPESGADAGARCKGDKGPKAVNVGTYCIDATEVTGAQYKEFLAAKAGDTSGQPPACAGNTTFLPGANPGDTYPVEAVDWCDAYAFCAWAGKRLCGKVAGGGNVPSTMLSNAFADEWFRACSHEGTRTYPYGSTYTEGACVVADAGPPRPAGSTATCEGGYPGIFDMAGNLWEWEDSCDGDAGGADICTLRGCSYAAGGGATGECAQTFSGKRDGTDSYDVTIRCCSDLE